MKNLKVWPHLVIVAVVCAVAAGMGVGLWMKHEQSASAEALPNAARIQRVEGDVALNNSNATNVESDQWTAATNNQPFSVGDRIYTRGNSRASLAFTGRNFARLDPNTSLDVLSLSDRSTQLALRDGSAIFDVGYLNSGDLFEVATPYGAVDFQQPGLYNVGIDNGQVFVSVLSGLAQVVGLDGSGQINKGELLTLIGQTAADVVLSRLDGRDAGYLVDDYYGYQYPQYYDGRYRDYNTYLSDPYYFDPYRRNVSYQYVNSYIPGLYDLDYYGDWRNVDKLRDTTVITSTTPVAPPKLAKSMRVDTVSDRVTGQKLKVKDERQRQEREQQRIDRATGTAQAERAARSVRQEVQGERVAASQQKRQEQPRARHEKTQQKQRGPEGNPSHGGGGKGKGKKP